ncbi:MAG: hypothetical protein Kow0090_16070 [Myxococcota bacterium]
MKRYKLWVLASYLSRLIFALLIMLGALWATYLNLYYAYNNSRLVGLSNGKLWKGFYELVSRFDSTFSEKNLLSKLFFGAPGSLTLFGVPFNDPIPVLPTIIADPSSISTLIPGLLSVLLAAIIIGRAFCSFACPASLFFALNLRIRRIVERLFPPLARERREIPQAARIGILAGGTIAAILFGNWVWNFLLPYTMISSELVSLASGAPFSAAFGVAASIILADLLVFPGEICRSVCPLGFLLGRASKSALVRVKASQKECRKDCNICTLSCDLALSPSKGAVADCNLCGVCALNCPVQKLSIGVASERFYKRAATIAALALLTLVAALNASAHHYKGLPHYNYFENYPQVPTDEFIASNGRWEIDFTIYNFQGMERGDVGAPDDVQVFLIIYDLKERKAYSGEAEVSIRSGEKTLAKWKLKPEMEYLFRMNAKIESPDDLSLSVNFHDEKGKKIEIAYGFFLPGLESHNPYLWGAFGIIALIALIFGTTKKSYPLHKKVNKDELIAEKQI